MKTKQLILQRIKSLQTIQKFEGEQAEMSALEWATETDNGVRDIGRRIVCAAIRFEDDTTIIGPRHFCPTMRKLLIHCDNNDHPVEGFIDQHGQFLTREEAWIVADEAGQIIRRVGGDGVKLYSENLY